MSHKKRKEEYPRLRDRERERIQAYHGKERELGVKKKVILSRAKRLPQWGES